STRAIVASRARASPAAGTCRTARIPMRALRHRARPASLLGNGTAARPFGSRAVRDSHVVLSGKALHEANRSTPRPPARSELPMFDNDRHNLPEPLTPTSPEPSPANATPAPATMPTQTPAWAPAPAEISPW